jgi:zinc D-Ala-D-Ala dipeptidase
MKPYWHISIQDCGEPLVAISSEQFVLETPHPYQKLGASYQEKSPFFLREGVLNSLNMAQIQLQKNYPNWRIKIFDAYRPVEVQQFMVDYTFAAVLQNQGLEAISISSEKSQEVWQQVYQLWAVPSLDPATPPPHSTGAAVDLTLVDERGMDLAMGGEIDELSERSHPDFYLHSTDAQKQRYHSNRRILYEALRNCGFHRHPGEWWHFCLGDQMWAWLESQINPATVPIAVYGRV